jgi:hypothetical protein
MRVRIGDVRLFFDVDGEALRPDGAQMRQVPTLLLLHGGPGGGDHSWFKPLFGQLRDVAQVIYISISADAGAAIGARKSIGTSHNGPTTFAHSATRSRFKSLLCWECRPVERLR